MSFLFFFNDTATTEIYTLSLHDALPIFVLDADSLMQGDTMVRLAALMEANPRTGLIQTHIVPAGRETLFARMLQFSSRATGVVLAMGNTFWQTIEPTHFRHNTPPRLAPSAHSSPLPC